MPLAQPVSAFAGGCNNYLGELVSRCSRPLRNYPREPQMACATAQKMRVPIRTTVDQVQVGTTVAMKKETFSTTAVRGTGCDSVVLSYAMLSDD